MPWPMRLHVPRHRRSHPRLPTNQQKPLQVHDATDAVLYPCTDLRCLCLYSPGACCALYLMNPPAVPLDSPDALVYAMPRLACIRSRPQNKHPNHSYHNDQQAQQVFIGWSELWRAGKLHAAARWISYRQLWTQGRYQTQLTAATHKLPRI